MCWFIFIIINCIIHSWRTWGGWAAVLLNQPKMNTTVDGHNQAPHAACSKKRYKIDHALPIFYIFRNTKLNYWKLFFIYKLMKPNQTKSNGSVLLWTGYCERIIVSITLIFRTDSHTVWIINEIFGSVLLVCF